MKKYILLSLTIYAFFPHGAAYAMDQVTLKSGEVIQGKVLSEAPLQHVDIESQNGTPRRIPYDQVSSVDRDIPVTRAQEAKFKGNQSLAYFGLLAGGAYPFTGINPQVSFAWGLQAGFITGYLGDSQFGIGVGFTRASRTESGITATVSGRSELLAQLTFRKVGSTGFYFGPEAGLAIRNSTLTIANTNTDIGSITSLDLGALLGYEGYLSDSFSLGPELHISRLMSGTLTYLGSSYTTEAETLFRFLLAGTLHF